MDEYQRQYWERRLGDCAKALERNGFAVRVAADADEAGRMAEAEIEVLSPASVGYADSRTLRRTGLLDRLRADERRTFIDGFRPDVPREEKLEARRRALLSDVFLTGANALTEKGEAVWLDMVGNRIAGVAFGPRHVFLFVGRNKLVGDLEEARRRIKSLAAPLNAMAHPRFRTPCQVTARCHDCASPDRICNQWLILEKCFPKGRIRIFLIHEDLGF